MALVQMDLTSKQVISPTDLTDKLSGVLREKVQTVASRTGADKLSEVLLEKVQTVASRTGKTVDDMTAICAGDKVIVQQTFTSFGHEIVQNTTGIVNRVDRDGDARIVFNAVQGEVCVLEKDFIKLKIQGKPDWPEQPPKARSRTTSGEGPSKEPIVKFLNDVKDVEDFKDKAIVLVRDPEFQTCTIATATGAVTFGSVGGAFGLASGVAVGSAAGIVPALLTFGLSIPAGAIVGGSGGLFTGVLVGGSAGGITGYEAYKYRVEIKDGVVSAKLQALNTVDAIKDNVVPVAETTRAKALKIVDLATSTRAGVTSTAAAGGAVVGGVTGGAAGVFLGAAVGVVPAIFTFGLSIPVAATAGLCLGSVTGGSAGAVGGGAVGYGGFTYRKWAKAKATACSAK